MLIFRWSLWKFIYTEGDLKVLLKMLQNFAKPIIKLNTKCSRMSEFPTQIRSLFDLQSMKWETTGPIMSVAQKLSLLLRCLSINHLLRLWCNGLHLK